MSKQSKKELILKLQEDYIGELDRRKKSRILDAVCSATGYDRKCAIKRLSGKRPYKARPVRGKSWGEAEEKLLVEAWNGAGNPCGKYLKAVIDEVLAGFGVLQHVDSNMAGRMRGPVPVKQLLPALRHAAKQRQKRTRLQQ